MKKIHPEILRRIGRDPEIIFKRDGWKCLICGTKEDLTIDHIDGNGRKSKIPNNKINNLRTLCRRCHGRIDGIRGGGYPKWGDYNGKVKCTCKKCRKEFYLWASNVIRGEGLFCSNKCRYS